MMLAETYGMMPSAKIESCSSAPPLNRLNRLRNDPDCACMIWRITLRSTPGVVMKMPTRYTASIPNENSRRLRRSGILKMFAMAFIMATTPGGSACGRFFGGRRIDQLGLAACLLDRFLRARAEGVRAHGQRLVEGSLAEHLHGVEAALHEARLAERRGVDHGALVEAREAADVDHGDVLREWVPEAELRQPAHERRLAALEAAAD